MAARALKRLLGEYEEMGYTWEVYAAGTTDRDLEICLSHGFTTIRTANTPVGKKFNDLALYMYREEKDAEWYMEYCSDNVCRPGYARAIQDKIDEGYDMVLTREFYMVHKIHGGCKRFTGGASNVGRMTRWETFEKVMKRYGMAYEPRFNSRLDQNFRKRCKNVKARMGFVDLADDIPYVLDVKSEASMHKFRAYNGKRFPVVSLQGDFPEFHEIHKQWPRPQEKSDPIRSASTSATPASQKRTPSKAEEPTETIPASKMTHSSLSPAPPPAPSRGRSKSSTRRRKTTTAKGKSSPAD